MDITPTSFSTSAVSTITIASQGQPSRKQPSGPLLVHFLHPMHRMGSIWMRPNGGWSSSGTQNMQSATGQYSTQAGDPAQPVQHSVITASSLGFFWWSRFGDGLGSHRVLGLYRETLMTLRSIGSPSRVPHFASGPQEPVQLRYDFNGKCQLPTARRGNRSHFPCPDTTISTHSFLLYWPFRRSPKSWQRASIRSSSLAIWGKTRK